MGGRGDEYGVEIDDLHAQRLQVVQLFQHAHQVAAVVAAVVVRLGHGFPGAGMAYVILRVPVFPVHHVALRVALPEAVRQDLVLHRALGPLGHMKPRNHLEGPGRVRRGHGVHPPGAPPVEVNIPVPPLHQEGIEHRLRPAVDFGLIPVEGVVALVFRHVCHDRGEALEQLDGHLRPLQDAQADGDVIARLRLGGLSKQLRPVAEYRG